MSEIPDLQGGDEIATSWGNPIKDRTVMRYANAVARDASIPVPVEGDMAFLALENIVTYFATGAWRTIFTTDGGEIGNLTVQTPINALAGLVSGGPVNVGDEALFGVSATSMVSVSSNAGLLGINQVSEDATLGNATVLTVISDVNRAFQISVGTDGTAMHIRGGTGGVWSGWTELATV